MIKRIFTCYNIILTGLLIVCSSFKLQPDPVREIILEDEPAGFIPLHFYIKGIFDGRTNVAAVASLLPADVAAGSNINSYKADLKGGGFSAVKHFFNHNLARNTSLHGVNLTIKKIDVVESPAPGGNADGHIYVTLSFSMPDQFDEDKQLIDYNGSATYLRKPGNPQEIEPSLRHLLINGLRYFNTWVNREANTDIRFANKVNVLAEDASRQKEEGDSIIYDASRPLTWEDFQSKTASRSFDAEVFPSFGYNEHTELDSGTVKVKLGIKVFMAKSSSWVKASSRSERTLNHEQRHFDISKIIAERFKENIKKEKFKMADYEATINEIYLDCYRALHTMEMQYDNETNHGTIETEQDRWDRKIDGELKKLRPI